MSKIFAILFILSWVSVGLAQMSTVTKPSVSSQCSFLMEQRKNKIRSKQKAQAILLRAQNLIKKTPAQKESIKEKAENVRKEVQNEMEIIVNNIESLEEDLIRKGCPGIIL